MSKVSISGGQGYVSPSVQCMEVEVDDTMLVSLHVMWEPGFKAPVYTSTKDTRTGSHHKVSLSEISMPVQFSDISIVISALLLIQTPWYLDSLFFAGLILINDSSISILSYQLHGWYQTPWIFGLIVLGGTDLYKWAKDPHRVKKNILNQSPDWARILMIDTSSKKGWSALLIFMSAADLKY